MCSYKEGEYGRKCQVIFSQKTNMLYIDTKLTIVQTLEFNPRKKANRKILKNLLKFKPFLFLKLILTSPN